VSQDRPPDPYAPPGAFPPDAYPPSSPDHPTRDDRTNAMLAHVLSVFAGFFGPLIIYIVKRKESRFVGFHALQALLWHFALMIMMFGGGIVFMLTIGLGVLTFPEPASKGAPPPPAFFLGIFGVWAVMMLSWFVSMGFSIYMATQASSGKWTRYPVIGRLAQRWSGFEPPR
jgi:uncharacterized Tic20 family protein